MGPVHRLNTGSCNVHHAGPFHETSLYSFCHEASHNRLATSSPLPEESTSQTLADRCCRFPRHALRAIHEPPACSTTCASLREPVDSQKTVPAASPDRHDHPGCS